MSCGFIARPYGIMARKSGPEITHLWAETEFWKSEASRNIFQ